MPNYCYHQMYCYGTTEDIGKLKQRILVQNEHGEISFDFNRVIPMPEELMVDVVSPISQELQAIYQSNQDKYGYPHWYDWARSEWGTKWNALHTEIMQDTEGYLALSFDTAWSPAEPVYCKLSELFPEVDFTIHYIEMGADFAGTYSAVNGEFVDEPYCGHLDNFAAEHFGWDVEEDVA